MRLQISKSYGETQVFDNFALEIADGEVLCVLGASGVGKTTLLNILAGLTDCVGEKEGIPDSVGYIFQEPRLLPNLTVKQNLFYTGANAERIEETLQAVHLLAKVDKKPASLSGGEKQRLAIARAFLSDAELLLLDEPFSSLDIALKIRLWQVFARLWEQEKERKKRTAVLVTHDIEEAWALGQRIILLEKGRVALDVRPSGEEYPRAYGEASAKKERILRALLGEEITQ